MIVVSDTEAVWVACNLEVKGLKTIMAALSNARNAVRRGRDIARDRDSYTTAHTFVDSAVLADGRVAYRRKIG